MPLLPPADVDLAYTAAQKVVEVHRRLVEHLRVGLTLAHIDAFVARQLEELGCKSAFLGYRQGRTPAFPSYACLSPNACIVHGTAGMTTEHPPSCPVSGESSPDTSSNRLASRMAT